MTPNPATHTYATATCRLGLIILVGNERGVSAIAMGDDLATLVSDALERSPGAQPDAGAGLVTQWLDTLVAWLNAPGSAPQIPCLPGGTPFQQSVWKALQDIPTGQTRTYTQVAEALDAPDAVRAVAGACAANPIALLIPCHRVLRTDGTLSGFRWGVERKRALLALERTACPPASARGDQLRLFDTGL